MQNNDYYCCLRLDFLQQVKHAVRLKISFQGSLEELHNTVCDAKAHNFSHSQILVPNQLNIKEWQAELCDYWDKQLILLLKYGFPLDFDYSNPLHATYENHKSANMH